VQSTDLGQLVIGAIIGVVLVITLPVIFMFAGHEPEVIAIPLFTFLALVLVRGLWRKFKLTYKFDHAPNYIIVPLCLTGPLWVFGLLALLVQLHG
jgi:hypothetical protein